MEGGTERRREGGWEPSNKLHTTGITNSDIGINRVIFGEYHSYHYRPA